MTGCPTSQPRQAEAALPALLKTWSVAVLAAGADPGYDDAVHVQGDTEGETSVSLRNKLELLWKVKTGCYWFVCLFVCLRVFYALATRVKHLGLFISQVYDSFLRLFTLSIFIHGLVTLGC